MGSSPVCLRAARLCTSFTSARLTLIITDCVSVLRVSVHGVDRVKCQRLTREGTNVNMG